MSNKKEVVVELTEAQHIAFMAKVAQFARERGLMPDGAVSIGLDKAFGNARPVFYFDVEIDPDGTGAE